MATGEEFEKFLSKRGFVARVEKINNELYVIALPSNQLQECLKLIASIKEPGRFLVYPEYDTVINGFLIEFEKVKQGFNELKGIEKRLNNTVSFRMVRAYRWLMSQMSTNGKRLPDNTYLELA